MNWGIAGHEWVVSLLKEHITQERLRHAYLFTGASGVGRRTLALRLAQAMNCPQVTAVGDPCLACAACRKIEEMAYPDLSIVQSEYPGAVLKVDQVRELMRSLALSPYRSHFRIALLLRFEEAHTSASNALLKTLEEPSEHVIMILTADSVDNLLPTVVSRCEVMRLRPLGLDKLKRWLIANKNIPDNDALLLAHISGGRPGYALSLHDQPGLLERRNRFLDDHLQLVTGSRVQRFEYISSLVTMRDMQRTRQEIRDRLMVWTALWRDVLLSACGASIPIVNQDQRERIAEMAGMIGYERSRATVLALQRAQYLISRNVNPRLAAEWVMLNLPEVHTGP